MQGLSKSTVLYSITEEVCKFVVCGSGCLMHVLACVQAWNAFPEPSGMHARECDAYPILLLLACSFTYTKNVMC